MKITKIKEQSSNSKRYNIYLDDNFWLGVSRDTLVKYGLKKNKIISNSKKHEISQTEKTEQAWQKSLHYLSYRNRSQQEIIDYLKKKKFNEKIIGRVLEKLKRFNYINDSRFLIDWINNRINNGKGPRYIYSELLNKGFKKEEIEESLSRCYDRDKQFKICLAEAEKYINKKKIKLKDYSSKQKVIRFLGQRGFDYDIIKEVIENILKN